MTNSRIEDNYINFLLYGNLFLRRVTVGPVQTSHEFLFGNLHQFRLFQQSILSLQIVDQQHLLFVGGNQVVVFLSFRFQSILVEFPLLLQRRLQIFLRHFGHVIVFAHIFQIFLAFE